MQVSREEEELSSDEQALGASEAKMKAHFQISRDTNARYMGIFEAANTLDIENLMVSGNCPA